MGVAIELLLTRLLPLIAAFGYLILHRVGERFLKAQWNAIASNHNIIVRSALSPLIGTAHGIRWLWRRVDSHISHAAAASLGILGYFFAGLTHVVEAIGKTVEDGQQQINNAIAHIIHVKTPAQIQRRVAPVKQVAGHALRVGERSISLNRRETGERKRAIDRIHWKWLFPLALAFGGIDAMHRHSLLHRVRTDHKTLERTVAREHVLERTTRAHARRLSRLEKLLGLGVITALLVRILARVAPWLFCRNWKKVGGKVCGLNASLLNWLLGLGAGMFVFTELCRIIDGLGGIAARVLPKLIAPLAVASAALCDGEHTAAPALPLQTTALPTVANPLPLA